jgi:hypothetical protein
MKTLLLITAGILSLTAYRMPSPVPTDELESPGGYKLLAGWMDVHFDIMQHGKIRGQQFRQLAYMSVALYESIVAGDPGYNSLAGQLNDYTTTPAPPENTELCWQASANEALATTMRYFYSDNPANVRRIDSMAYACRLQLEKQGFSIKAIQAGADYGMLVARGVLDWSKSDLSDKINDPFTIPSGPGMYEPTPPANAVPVQPHMGECRTMVKGSTDNTIPPPPVTFSEKPGSDFYKMVNEVYQTSQEKNQEKVATALFWDDFPDGKSLTAAGHWESILKTVITQKNMSLIEASTAYAGLFITALDASIGCFKAKYMYTLMRPVTYIRKYMHHEDWSPLIITPAHPEYPAAHATCSMAAATILTHLLGDHIAFTDNSYAYRNYPAHEFNSFKEAGTEAGLSRLYGGIHYRPSIVAGSEQGAKIAENIARTIVFK